jgi:hypothetical protein
VTRIGDRSELFTRLETFPSFSRSRSRPSSRYSETMYTKKATYDSYPLKPKERTCQLNSLPTLVSLLSLSLSPDPARLLIRHDQLPHRLCRPLPLIHHRRLLCPRQPEHLAPPQILGIQSRPADASGARRVVAVGMEGDGEVSGLGVEPGVDEVGGIRGEGGEEVAFGAGIPQGEGKIRDLREGTKERMGATGRKSSQHGALSKTEEGERLTSSSRPTISFPPSWSNVARA